MPTNNQPVLFVLAIVLIATLIQSVYYYPKLPDQLPSHFTTAGEVDEYIAKPALFIMMLSTIFITALSLTSGTLLAMRKAPQLVNLPNKDYWFAPEHKQETITVVFKLMVKLTIATILMMIIIMQSIIWVSLGTVESVSLLIWSSIGLFSAYSIVIVIQLYVRFRLPVSEEEASA